MKRSLFLLQLCLGLTFTNGQPAQIQIQVENGVNPWNHLQVNNAPERFQFAIVSDRTGGLRPGVFPKAISKLNLLQPEFVMSVGDLISGYTEDEEVIDQEWDEFDGFIKTLEMPFFYVPGNHDYINPVMAKKWKERLGKDYYHFVYQEVLFLCLNTEEKMRGAGRGFIDDPQYAYIQKTLTDHPEVKWTLVFMHQPLWDQQNSGRWGDVEKLLAGRKHTVFVGHRHRFVKYERNNSKYFILATTGGGSGLRGPNFGEFDHVVWVTMTDEGPILANLMLDGIWDENVNTEDYFAFSRPLTRKPAWDILPIYAAQNGFAGGQVEVTLSNDSDVPMLAEAQIRSTNKLWAQSAPFHQTISPNSVEKWAVPLKTPNDQRIENTGAVTFDFTMTYKPENQPELVVKGSEKLSPIRMLPVPRSSTKINIDGNTTEWSNLRYSADGSSYKQGTPITHKGTEDCSVQFDFRYDASYIYLAARITDDQIESGDGMEALKQDGLFVILDARPTHLSFKGKGEGLFRSIMLCAVSPGKESPIVHWQDRYPKGTQIACVKNDTGYQVELALPVSYLHEKFGDNWKAFRFNLYANDSDYAGKHLSQIWWQPDWRTSENILGSGMFVKE